MITKEYLTQKIEEILELINGNDCDKVFFIRKDKLKGIKTNYIPGVYILLDKNEIVYIGSTVNLFQRLITHKGFVVRQKKLTKPMKWEGALCIVMDVDRDVYFNNEQKLIEFYRPKYNRQYYDSKNKRILINQNMEVKTRSYTNVIDILINMHFSQFNVNSLTENFEDKLTDFLSNFEDKQIRIRMKKKCLQWFMNEQLID